MGEPGPHREPGNAEQSWVEPGGGLGPCVQRSFVLASPPAVNYWRLKEMQVVCLFGGGEEGSGGGSSRKSIEGETELVQGESLVSIKHEMLKVGSK